MKFLEAVVIAVMAGAFFATFNMFYESGEDTSIQCRKDALTSMCVYYGNRTNVDELGTVPFNGGFFVRCTGEPTWMEREMQSKDYLNLGVINITGLVYENGTNAT